MDTDPYDLEVLVIAKDQALAILAGDAPLCPIILLSVLSAAGSVGDAEVCRAALAHPEVVTRAMECLDLSDFDDTEEWHAQFDALTNAYHMLPPPYQEWWYRQVGLMNDGGPSHEAMTRGFMKALARYAAGDEE